MFSARVQFCSVDTFLHDTLTKVSKGMFLNVRDEQVALTRISTSGHVRPTHFATKNERFDVAPQVVTAEYSPFELCERGIFFNNRVPKFWHIFTIQ